MKLTAPQRRVLEYMSSFVGSSSQDTVRAETGLSLPSLYVALAALEEAGFVFNVEGGRQWSITDAGRQAVAE